jgi:2'-5' RNA ligase
MRGVVAWFDAVTEQRLLALWTDLAGVGVAASAPPSRPHVSLLVADDIAERAVDDLTALRPDLAVSLGAVALFPPTILHLPVTATRGLLELQAAVVAAVGDAARGVDRFYATPAAWQPHCTLAAAVPDELLVEAVRLARAVLPLSARLTSMGLEEAGTHRRWPI